MSQILNKMQAPITKEQRAELKKRVQQLVDQDELEYREAWRIVHEATIRDTLDKYTQRDYDNAMRLLDSKLNKDADNN